MTARVQHWAAPLVGMPYEQAGSCWAFARDVLARRHGVELPAVAIGNVDLQAIKAAFREHGMRRVGGKPAAGDLVVMRSPVLRTHVGVVIESGGALAVLHATEQAGVVCEPYGESCAGRRVDLWRAHPGLEGEAPDWQDAPGGRDAFRSLLQVAAVIALNYAIPGSGFAAVAARTAVAIAVNFALNALLPPTGLEVGRQPGQTGEGLTASLSGNIARLDQPIWKTCGFDEINPPFAGQPYAKYLPRAGTTGDAAEEDREQYLYAVYCVGIGTHDVFAKLGNTPLSRYDDVVEATYLPPGSPPTVAKANIVTNESVAGIRLESGRYSPGFVACPARQKVAKLSVVVSAPRGLGKGGDPKSVEWKIETREINDFGQVLTSWAELATENRDDFYTASPQFWDEEYTIATPKRLEVRVVRTDTEDTDATALHELAWVGLRAELDDDATLNADAAHFELVLRTSGQLAGAAARDLRLIVQSKARTRSGGSWVSASFTRNPIDWILDLATSNSGAWGLALTDDRINLDGFDALRTIASNRQDRFDYTFTETVDAWEAMQLIARACRSRVFRRNGVLSIARDQLADVPVTAFTPRNCLPGSMKVVETMRRGDSPDAVVVEYRDHRTREWTPIVCPIPGVAEVDVERPVYRRLMGVIGATHAEREGLYEAAVLLYRTRTAQWTTELQGLLPAYMSACAWQSDSPGVGQTGDVVDWDAGTLTATLSDVVDFTDAPIYIRLMDSDGTLTDAIEITAGAQPNEVVLDSDPGITVNVDAYDRERTVFMAAPLTAAETVKVLSIGDGGTQDGAQFYALTGVIDDDRVHEADEALLPGVGETQDPIGLPDDDEGGGVVLVVNLTNQTIQSIVTGIANTATYRLKDNGGAEKETSVAGATAISQQWLRYGPWTDTETGLFECRFELVSGDTPTGTLDTWLALDTTREVSLSAPTVDDVKNCVVRVKVRLTSSGVVQDSALITMQATYSGA